MKKTKKNYERYLNDLYYNQDIVEMDEVWQFYAYLPAPLLRKGKLGTCLRRHDPIQFECGFDEWKP